MMAVLELNSLCACFRNGNRLKLLICNFNRSNLVIDKVIVCVVPKTLWGIKSRVECRLLPRPSPGETRNRHTFVDCGIH